MRVTRSLLALAFVMAPLAWPRPVARQPQVSNGVVELLAANGSAITELTDGDRIRMRVTLAMVAGRDEAIEFSLEGEDTPVAACTIPAGQTTCTTAAERALGWRWLADGSAMPQRTIRARPILGTSPIGQVTVSLAPRPVVMVHGFGSSWEAWVNYLGPNGYLSRIQVPGFAVGDGQVAGTLNTGSLTSPMRPTNTLFENARVLGEYVAGVKRVTGAQMVDLLVHSMGGLIARAYIDREMSERDVAQLIMLGSPMAGTDCADLPAALGLYLPATIELRPSYVRGIFNAQVQDRRGVTFHALAGVPIVDSFRSPCTDVPTDLAVSLESVTAIPIDSARMEVLHTDLNLSAGVFEEYVLHLLQTPVGRFEVDAGLDVPSAAGDEAQFSRLFTGHVDAGSSRTLTIPIDQGIQVASFSLYDPTRSLQVSVTGASGNTIELSAERNGLVILHDPAALFYLGYGFADPRPGMWRVEVLAGASTPQEGADYALTARFVGGAFLRARMSALVALPGEPLDVSASLELDGRPLPLTGARAVVRLPDGRLESVEAAIAAEGATWRLRPEAPGLYAIDLTAEGLGPDGIPIERTVFLAFEVERGASGTGRTLWWIGGAMALVVMGALTMAILQRRRARGRAVPRGTG